MSRNTPYLIGLTGSIGMGKSTTAEMFRAEGVPVWDADATVHALYAKGGAAVAAIKALRPEAIVDGAVSRPALRDWIAQTPDALQKIEAAVLPLLAQERQSFIANCASRIAVLDMPTLFETGGERFVDTVVVVSAPAEVQWARVMERPGMTGAQFQLILTRQMPDAEKRARSNHVIETRNLEDTRTAVQSLLRKIREQLDHA